MPDKIRHQVFVSSTFTDLREERQRVAEALLQIDCIPAGMELFPAADAEQFEFIKTIIDDCDYYVVVIGGRYGSLSAEGLSYTELEYRYASSKGVPVLAFLHEAPGSIPIDRSELDPALRAKLEAFKQDLRNKRLSASWKTSDDLVTKVVTSMVRARKMHPRPGWIRGDQAASKKLLHELIEAKSHIAHLQTELVDSSFPEDVTLRAVDVGFETDGRRYHILLGLDHIFLTLGAKLALPTRLHLVESTVTDIIKKSKSWVEEIQVLPSDVERITSNLYGHGLVDIDEDEQEFRTLVITTKGRRVLSLLLAQQGDDPEPPESF